MSEYIIQSSTLTGIADAIREKTDISRTIDPAEMASLISGISVGGAGGRVATGTWEGGTPDRTYVGNYNITTYYYRTVTVSCPFKPTKFFFMPNLAGHDTGGQIISQDGTNACSMFACLDGVSFQPIYINSPAFGYKWLKGCASETYDATTETLTYTFESACVSAGISGIDTYTWIAIE